MSDSSLLGQLIVRSTFDTTQFSKGVSSFKSGLTSAIGSVGGFGASLLSMNKISAVVAATFAAGFKGLAALDDLSASAAKIGITAASLGELHRAAENFDVAISSLEGGLKKLVKNIGELQLGNSAVSAAFDQLGLSLADVQSKSGTEQFSIVVEKLKAIEDPALQAAIGCDIFGKSFQDLKPLIDGGAASIEKAAKEARAFGQVLNEDQTKRADEANVAWDRFKSATDGATKSIAASLAPAMEGLFEIGISLLTDVLKPMLPILTGLGYVAGLAAKIIATGFSGVAMVLQATVSMFLKAAGLFSDTAQKWSEEWEQAAKDSAQNIRNVWSDVEAGEESIAGVDAAMVAATASSDQLWENLTRGATSAANAVKSVWNQIMDQGKKVQSLIADYQKQIRQFDMSQREKQIDDLGQVGLGFTPEQQATVQGLSAQLTAKEKEKEANEALKRAEEDRIKAVERAEQDKANRISKLKQDAMTDEQKMAEKWNEIVSAFWAKEITAEEYQSLTAKYMEEKNGKSENIEAGPNDWTAGNAAFAGSSQAQDTILRGLNRGRGSDDPINDVKKNTGDTVTEAKKQTVEMKKIAKKLDFKMVS